jgi:phosphohistidine swiveling domain-containing protein
VPHTVVRLAYDANESGAPGASGRAWAELGRRMERRWRRVASHVLKREAAGSTFVHAYGLLRPVVLEIGRRLVGRGKAGAADDVFYVDIDRVLSAFTGEGDIIGEAEATRRDLDLVSDLDMPDLIVGDRWLPESRAVGDRLRGVGVSRGRYRGTARFVGSLADSSLLEPGEVLVVERSDVAWTPLFTRAGGVVSSVGGILAHAAITARELGIPCVSSVDGARSLDGRQVLIDGFTGEILIEG